MKTDQSRKKYNFTFDWFQKNIDIWEKLFLHQLSKKAIQVLEVGVFEGASTTWIIDNLNPHIAIDTFLSCFAPEINVLHKAYQVIVKKTKRTQLFTKLNNA